MRMKSKTVLTLSVLLPFSFGALPGCNQADNPKPEAAPPPPAPKASELELPKVKGKSFDPSANPRYKAMQENMAKQSGGK
jgi:hypothetical protein